jgi:integrase
MELNDFFNKITHALLTPHVKHGLSKKQEKTLGIKCIRSIGTERNFRACIYKFVQWRDSCGLSVRGPYLKSEMVEFLWEQAQLLQQKQLNTVRQALQLVFRVELESIESSRSTILKARSYLADEVTKIMSHQSDRNAISTALCVLGGLRGVELLTLRSVDEIKRSSHRTWRSDLFKGLRDYAIYVVTGKGGLVRHVAIPIQLSQMLESRRFAVPRKVRDRGIDYLQQYDIGGGQAFAQSFGDASVAAIGFSHGAHGLRHTYAQTRLQLLRCLGTPIRDALCIVSQELGHFRPEITLVYLR